jgi:DNA-binding IclR family transcriptional regulator
MYVRILRQSLPSCPVAIGQHGAAECAIRGGCASQERPLADGLRRSLTAVAALAASPKPLSAAELASELSLSRASAYRVLEDLEAAGWVMGAGGPKRYSLTLRFAQLCVTPLRHTVREAVLPHAIALARVLQCVCQVALYEDGDVVYTDAVEVDGDRISPTIVVGRAPAAATASGKILLAFQPELERERVIAKGLPQLTPRTKTGPADIRKDLDACRSRGFGIAFYELQLPKGAISFPIFDAEGTVVAALGAIAQGQIDNDDAMQVFAARAEDYVRRHSLRASVELGYRPPLLVGVGVG